jgi:putative ABC transport system ATP-binding protein
VLVLTDVRRDFLSGDSRVSAVAGVSLRVAPGEFVALVGPSGCGKSTLLHLCGAMDRPSAGRVDLEGRALDRLGDDELTRVRRARVGFVFQFFNLLPTLTAAENVALPRLLMGHARADVDASAREWLGRVGLTHRAGHYPRQLSGGEMQRVAIARALAHSPALVIADEPTGNLDSENGRRILDLLTEVNQQTGVTLLLATHAPDLAAAAGRLIEMRDGRVAADTPKPRASSPAPP